MIDKLQRLQLMELLSAYFQNENVPPEEKALISKGLLANDNILLHKRMVILKPTTEMGKNIHAQILKKLEEL